MLRSIGKQRSRSVRTRDLREWLATAPFPPIPVSSFPFPWCLSLIPIPVSLPKFIPIPSHSHSRLTNERHLSLNNQTMINVQMQTFNRLSLKISTQNRISYCHLSTIYQNARDVTLQHFIGLHSHLVDRWEFWHTRKIAPFPMTLDDLEGHSPNAGFINTIRRTFVRHLAWF